MSNSHPVVLLRQKVDLEEGELDAVVTRVKNLEDACTSNLENSNVSRIIDLEEQTQALENSRATITALDGVKETAEKAASDLSTLELNQVGPNAAEIALNKTNISTNSANIGLNATKEELKTQKERIDGHATDLSNVSTELDTKASNADFQDLSTNYAATAADFAIHKGIIQGNGSSISALNQRVKADEDNLAENYYTQTEIDATNTANTSRFNALDISVNLLRTDLTAAENKGGNNGILIHKNIQDISGLSGTVNENEQKQIDGDEVLKLRIDGHDASLNLLRQHVDEWDVLSKTEKANLAEVFQNMHKNWFAARSVATQNLQKDTDNELALAGIISGAHEKFTINGNKFSVSQSGYYSISADITSVFAGEV
jgi:hypothetical protein